jgi:uncharacterized protein YbbC (DUF1343 family)
MSRLRARLTCTLLTAIRRLMTAHPATMRILLLLLISAAFVPLRSFGLELGIDVLQSRDFDVLKGKHVGLVTNQTGVDNSGTKTRLILKKALGGSLVALFSPEHGLDGTAPAGAYVASRKDSATGLQVFSLHGPTRKPTTTMLKGIDTLVYDMQDIGVRSYTYISTMAKCMEACGENNVEFVVLDRPNPLGGQRVEGPGIESRWLSFVGIFPVPYLHGMTSGELAQMANGRGWTGAKCKLTVVPMRGWSRGMTWDETGLRWIRTSPNIPNSDSPLYYAVTSMVGSLKGVDVGTGTPSPFSYLKGPGLNGSNLATRLQSGGYPGVQFAALGNGVKMAIQPKAPANLCKLGVDLLIQANRAASPSLFARYRDADSIFWKVYGSTGIRAAAESGSNADSVASNWTGSVAAFRAARQTYLLY